jgi:putative two-component system response regulator
MGEKATILVVDDSEDVLNLVAATLGKEHTVRRAADGAAALHAAFEEPQPDLILLDVEMPDVSGFQICSTLKAAPQVADIPVIFLTGNADPRAVIEGFKLGAIDYLVKPVSPRVLAVRVQTHLELIKHRSRSDQLLAERTVQLERTRLELIRRLGRAMEYHETSAVGNRVVRLGHYARALAEAAGARPAMCDLIMKAAPLHDIGKVGVPASVLRKGGALTAPEREQMQRHPEIGAEIIGEHEDALLKLARTLAYTHHERWDGNGYPTGAKGGDIPWAGRLMAIVDSFESMTATQFHREPRPIDLAADEIYRASGRQFDPQLVEAFRKAMPRFREIHATYGDQLGDLLNLDFSASVPDSTGTLARNENLETQAIEKLRNEDAERAQALAGAQARLQVERELAAAAQSDIVTRQAAIKKFEERAAREAELLAAAKARVAEENDAARLLRDQEEVETKAQQTAKQARLAELQAIAAAQEREKAAEAVGEVKESRKVAEEELEAAKRQRAEAEARAAEAERAAGIARKANEDLRNLLDAETAKREADERAARALAEKAAAEARAAENAQRAEAQSREALAAAEKKIAAEKALAEAVARRQAAVKAANEAAGLAREAAAQAEKALQEAAAAREADENEARALEEKTAAESRAAEFARKVESEARAAAAAARNRISQETLNLEAATQRQAEEEKAAGAAKAAAEAEAKVAELARQAEQVARKAEAAAKEKLLQAEKLAAAAADKLRAKQAVAGATASRGDAEKAAAQYREAKERDEAAAAAITIVAAQRRSRSRGLLLGFLLGLGVAAAGGWYAMEQEMLPALVVQNTPVAPPAPPQQPQAQPAPEPRPIFGDGEAVALRLDSAFEKIPAR